MERFEEKLREEEKSKATLEKYMRDARAFAAFLGQVRSIDVVNKLGYSKPSVSIAMKKLRESGYIVMAGDGNITLTATGMEIASRIYRRHKTITRLFELMGVSPEQAAADACKVEHDLSPGQKELKSDLGKNRAGKGKKKTIRNVHKPSKTKKRAE